VVAYAEEWLASFGMEEYARIFEDEGQVAAFHERLVSTPLAFVKIGDKKAPSPSF
jgi:hypothetical protein